MSPKLNSEIAVIGIDLGNIVLRQKWSRGQVEARLANVRPCLIGMEACVGAHHLSRKLQALGHAISPYSADGHSAPVTATHHTIGRCSGPSISWCCRGMMRSPDVWGRQ
jgi:hypothetical protein